jgi:16S rRNA processing protein RimM
MKKYLEIGKAVTVFGVRGEIKVYPESDSPAAVCAQKVLYLDEGGTRSIAVESARAHKNMALIKFKGVDTVEDASRYIDRTFYVDRDSIPKARGAFFIADLIGMRVVNDSGCDVGEVTGAFDTGAQTVLEIKTARGDVRMIPYMPAFIKSVDLELSQLHITPIKGLLDDED